MSDKDWSKYVCDAYNKMYSDLLKTYSTALKIGDKIRYKKFTNITGKITSLGDNPNTWIVNDALIATEDEIELDNDLPYWTPSIKKCTCGSSSVGSDRHSDYCDRYVK